nr:Chain C, Transcriptional activator TAX [synthetic construct]2GIT_F Chain F, Transcriptional activator TAX [synthetic construct]2GJ6_C Chain C, Modified HTLV-1 TAX (Y5K-IBA) peptide, chain C [synthetic construct]
LLFGKPVYV